MSIKVELPSFEAQRLLEEWRNKAMQLEGELGELQNAIASVEAQLNGKLVLTPDPAPRPSDPKVGKRKKGHNLRVLKAFLTSTAQKGATTAEISQSTGIGKSSVYIVLTKHTDTFTKGNDGLWRLK